MSESPRYAIRGKSLSGQAIAPGCWGRAALLGKLLAAVLLDAPIEADRMLESPSHRAL